MKAAPVVLLAVACLALGGCASAPPPPPAPTAKRLPLTTAQEAAIHAAIANALKDMTDPVFPLLAAAAEPDGATYVCGTVKPGAGSYQDVTPFALLLKDKDLAILAIGGNDRDNRTVKDLCKSKGIEGLVGVMNGPRRSGWLASLFGR